ncbi:hypothetical protein ENUP19_0102G0031 [Entamoeba nuttalli]|uniref:Zinc finger protein, putative n=2 Tax=Entamoeba nuttalli TaxID=412467 RepID=K2GY97_ENTNP|nr:zinc finger protein, putative [Entamoeba nuttalli P19]EKE40218.1 zinc finger protein, putative [Entamoeba nuttalli P19]|eukprot:XP_008857449.1 zinc finger protein, putative [Entamoeba nuttalli P19]
MNIQQQMYHLIHCHPLFLTDPFEVYKENHGWWKCDLCGSKPLRNELMYHCDECEFDVCASCYHQVIAHYHHLNHTFEPDYESRGKCCDCHKENNDKLFRCNQCVMVYCKQCFESLYIPSFHPHALYVSSPSILYPGKWWKCDYCQQVFGKNKFSLLFHCRECQTDYCFHCLSLSLKS